MGPADPESLLCGDPNAKFFSEKSESDEKEKKSAKSNNMEF